MAAAPTRRASGCSVDDEGGWRQAPMMSCVGGDAQVVANPHGGPPDGTRHDVDKEIQRKRVTTAEWQRDQSHGKTLAAVGLILAVQGTLIRPKLGVVRTWRPYWSTMA
jgi:hypothetical protein